MSKKLFALGLVALLVGTAWVLARPEAPTSPQVKPTIIAVDGMDCPSCAKKVVTRLNKVPGVAKVVADTDASKLSVSAQDKASPSPRAMWEAVELAGFKPLRIDGPGGSFTAKPEK